MLLRFKPRFRQPSLVSFADLKVWQPKKGNRHGGSRVPLPPVSNHWMTVSHPAAPPICWLPRKQEDLRGELPSPVWLKCGSQTPQPSDVRAVGMPSLSPLQLYEAELAQP